MNCTIPAAIISLLLAGPAQHASLSDRAGLALTLTEDGSLASVELNGHELPRGGDGGFYLREPNSPVRVPLRGRFFQRDGLSQLTATSPLKASLRASWTEGDGYIEIRGELTNLADRDRGLWLGFNVPLDATGWKWGKSLSSSPAITSNQPAYAEDNNLVPIPAIWNEHGGVAICIPPTDPCVFEVGADSTGLRIEMAFGLSKDTAKFPSKAPFRLRLYSIDGDWGFRDALAKYYDWYPEYYSIAPWVMKTLDHHHDWIGVNYVSDQGEEKTDHLIDPNKQMFMGYTKTSGRIQGLKNVAAMTTQQRVLDAIATTNTVQHFIKDAPAESPEIEEGREALLNSACYRPDETILTILKPKTGEIDFPINCDPDLFADRGLPVFGRHFLRKVDRIHKRGNYNSIHWDRVGGWGNSLNYRRDHFAYVDHPLTFDQDGRVCIHTKLTHYELFNALRIQGKQLGLFHEAAGMKVYGWSKQPNRPAGQLRDGRFFTAALVAGGWHEGSFKPIELGGFDFERMVVGRKSYRISSGNIVAHNEPPTLDKIKRALAQTTAYGFACPVQIQYFYTPDRPGYSNEWSWINKPEHRKLWDKYEPANLAIRLAGWEPVTHAVADSSAVGVERFGRDEAIYFTVWGPDPPDTVTIEIDSAALGLDADATFREIVGETKILAVESPKGWRLTLPMERDMTRVIKVVNGP